MNIFDVIILIILLYGLIKGFIKGFIIEVAGIIALILGVTGSFKFARILEVYLNSYVDWSPKTIQITSFIILFIIIIYAVSLLAKMITKTLKIIALGMINRIFGGIFHHYIFKKSWNQVAKSKGQWILFDQIHLNETGANILHKIVKNYISRG